MAKTFDKSIQNAAISLHFFVKWQFSFRVTFQAFYVHEKFSSFCWQYHTLKSTTVWMFSLVVWCSANKNMTIPWKKYPKKYDQSWKIFLFHGHFLSSFAAEVDKISKYWPKLNIQTANKFIVVHVALFLKQISTGHRRLLQVHTGQFYSRLFPFQQILLIAS